MQTKTFQKNKEDFIKNYGRWITWKGRKINIVNGKIWVGDIPKIWQGFSLDEFPWIKEDREEIKEDSLLNNSKEDIKEDEDSNNNFSKTNKTVAELILPYSCKTALVWSIFLPILPNNSSTV